MANQEVKPYQAEGSKKEQVATMFDNIAGKYDFLNHLFSLGIDIIWRKKAIKIVREIKPKTLLDIATGTGDFALEAVRMNIGVNKITGVDISAGMLEVGKKKIKERGLENTIELLLGDSENLPFDDASFDAITVAFGVRNFEHLEVGLAEMYRVLKPGGRVVILEFSKPTTFPMKQLFGFYFKVIMPVIGKLVSKDNAAYTYLPESVQAFPEGTVFEGILNKTGFINTRQKRLTGGIASIYVGDKK